MLRNFSIGSRPSTSPRARGSRSGKIIALRRRSFPSGRVLHKFAQKFFLRQNRALDVPLALREIPSPGEPRSSAAVRRFHAWLQQLSAASAAEQFLLRVQPPPLVWLANTCRRDARGGGELLLAAQAAKTRREAVALVPRRAVAGVGGGTAAQPLALSSPHSLHADAMRRRSSSASISSSGARRAAFTMRNRPISRCRRGSGLRRRSSSVCSRI